MRESNIMRLIQRELGRGDARLFRNNTGQGWVGRMRRLNTGAVVLDDARPLHAGLCEGSPDLVGWTSVTVTPDMVGKRVAVFTGIETKDARGRVTPEQANFIAAVRAAGGMAGVARSVEEATTIIHNREFPT